MTTFRILLSVFAVIFVAELPDKTALAALVLATQYHPLPVFVGAGLALTVQSVVAVVAGGMLSMLPARGVHVGAGLLFLACALLMWRRAPDREAAHYHDALTVFWGATLALWTVAGLAVFVGNRAGKLLDPERTQILAAGVFAVIGVLLIVGTI